MAGSIDGNRAAGFPQPPVSDRIVGQDGFRIADACRRSLAHARHPNHPSHQQRSRSSLPSPGKRQEANAAHAQQDQGGRSGNGVHREFIQTAAGPVGAEDIESNVSSGYRCDPEGLDRDVVSRSGHALQRVVDYRCEGRVVGGDGDGEATRLRVVELPVMCVLDVKRVDHEFLLQVDRDPILKLRMSAPKRPVSGSSRVIELIVGHVIERKDLAARGARLSPESRSGNRFAEGNVDRIRPGLLSQSQQQEHCRARR